MEHARPASVTGGGGVRTASPAPPRAASGAGAPPRAGGPAAGSPANVEHVGPAEQVGDRTEDAEHGVTAPERDVPVLPHAELEAQVERQPGGAERRARIVRASGQLAAPVAQVAALPLHVVRDRRPSAARRRAARHPDRDRGAREQHEPRLDQVRAREAGDVPRAAGAEPHPLKAVARARGVARAGERRFDRRAARHARRRSRTPKRRTARRWPAPPAPARRSRGPTPARRSARPATGGAPARRRPGRSWPPAPRPHRRPPAARRERCCPRSTRGSGATG